MCVLRPVGEDGFRAASQAAAGAGTARREATKGQQQRHQRLDEERCADGSLQAREQVYGAGVGVMNCLVMMRAGQPWTSEEHLQFLAGLKKLGRSNWRGISRYFVPTRTPTQVKRLQQATQLFYCVLQPEKRIQSPALEGFLLDPAVL